MQSVLKGREVRQQSTATLESKNLIADLLIDSDYRMQPLYCATSLRTSVFWWVGDLGNEYLVIFVRLYNSEC